jgi:uncharacterized membrane protein
LGSFPLVPAGTTLPPLPYLLGIVLAASAVAVSFRRRSPTVTGAHVLALAPWMALGAAAHVLFVVGGLPALLAPLGGSPTVYLTTATLAGGVWLAASAVISEPERVPKALAAVGTLGFVATLVAVSAQGIPGLGARWAGLSVVLAVPLALVAWSVLAAVRPAVASIRRVGQLVVFGHALDGVSTALGVTQLGFGERSPLSRIILELGVPSMPVLGEAWLFVLVKLVVSGGVISLFAPTVREAPREGLLLVAFVAAVGLGPAIHNLLLFSVSV